MFATILVAVLFVYVQAQSPPALPQQFTTSFQGIAQGQPVTIVGQLALDAVQFGLFANATVSGSGIQILEQAYGLPSAGSVSLYVATNLPNNPTNPCMLAGTYPTAALPPFALPKQASFVGKQVINGVAAQGWYLNVSTIIPTPGASVEFTAWLSLADGSFVQLIEKVAASGTEIDVTINFSNTVLGPVNPALFQPPAACNPSQPRIHSHAEAVRSHVAFNALNAHQNPTPLRFFSFLAMMKH